jgi:hypothetical protein
LHPVTKIGLNIIGSIAVLLGVLGIFLPLVPTTPFLLLAAACYLRGSQRLHRWLMNNKVLGPYIRNIKEKRGISRRAKIATITLLWASVLLSIYKVDLMAVKPVLVVIGITTSTLILKMKTLKQQE